MTISRAILLISIYLVFGFSALSVAQETRETDVIGFLPFHMENAHYNILVNLRTALYESADHKAQLSPIPWPELRTQLLNAGVDTAEACLSIECMRLMGNILDARFVISGSITHLEQRTTIEIWAVDEVAGTITATDLLEIADRDPEASERIEELAERFITKIISQPGYLYVETEPEASRVEIDGYGVGISPMTIIRPGNTTYRVGASRLGWRAEARDYYLPEMDTVRIHIQLNREATFQATGPFSLHFWGSAGLPLYASSSTSDAGMSWGGGNSLGMATSFGTQYRVRFGLYTYEGVVEGVAHSILNDYNVKGRPRGKANVLSVSFLYLYRSQSVHPFFEAGITAMRRGIELEIRDANTLETEADYQAGWLFGFGFEFDLYKSLGMQIEMLYTRPFTDTDSWKESDIDYHRVWEYAYNEFSGFTIIRASIGYRL